MDLAHWLPGEEGTAASSPSYITQGIQGQGNHPRPRHTTASSLCCRLRDLSSARGWRKPFILSLNLKRAHIKICVTILFPLSSYCMFPLMHKLLKSVDSMCCALYMTNTILYYLIWLDVIYHVADAIRYQLIRNAKAVSKYTFSCSWLIHTKWFFFPSRQASKSRQTLVAAKLVYSMQVSRETIGPYRDQSYRSVLAGVT